MESQSWILHVPARNKNPTLVSREALTISAHWKSTIVKLLLLMNWGGICVEENASISAMSRLLRHSEKVPLLRTMESGGSC